MRRIRVFLIIAAVSVSSWAACGSSEDPVGGNGGDPPLPTGPDTIAPAAIIDIVSRSPGAGSIALQWIAPGDDDWTGTAASYDIRFSRTEINEGNWEQASPVPFPPAPVQGRRVQTHRVKGLDALTIYFFAIKTKDEADNESGLSKIAQGQTLQEHMPPSAITDLNADAVGDSTILLTWTAPGDDGVFGTATRYHVRWMRHTPVNATNWENAEVLHQTPPPGPAGAAESLLVKIPEPNSNYGFAVMSEDEAGNVSEISNVCRGLGLGSYLWIFPLTLRKGNDLTILYRSNGVSRTRVQWMEAPLRPCGGPNAFVDSFIPAGTYETSFDFFNQDSGNYYRAGRYLIVICLDGATQKSMVVDLID